MPASVTAELFVREFRNVDPAQPVMVDVGGAMPLAIKGQASPGAKSLVVQFHGAIDRTKRKTPAFLDMRPGLGRHAHQISIADPSLELSPDLTNAWFAGSRQMPLQKLLPKLIQSLVTELDIERVIFFGSSGGGFAALFYSWHFPGSIAVVSAPQTNIRAYYPGRRKGYFETCWGKDSADIRDFCFDLRELYREKVPNTVVYLQSQLDTHHYAKHLMPLIASLPSDGYERFVTKTSYWGRRNHSGAVPAGEFNLWVKAAVASDETDVQSIVEARYKMGDSEKFSAVKRPSISSSSGASTREMSFDPQDVELARLIAKTTDTRES